MRSFLQKLCQESTALDSWFFLPRTETEADARQLPVDPHFHLWLSATCSRRRLGAFVEGMPANDVGLLLAGSRI